MKLAIFVTSINKVDGCVIVTAANGSPEGPPFAKWYLPIGEFQTCTIGSEYSMEITKR